MLRKEVCDNVYENNSAKKKINKKHLCVQIYIQSEYIIVKDLLSANFFARNVPNGIVSQLIYNDMWITCLL